MNLLLAILTGVGLGYILERGDMCFHSTLRGLVRTPRQPDLFRAYLLALLLAAPLVNGLIALGWIRPWIPPFAWQANIVGGMIFGAGMVIASSCITGLFYKLGHGMLGALVGLSAWAVGDIAAYRGPLAPLRDALNASQVRVSGASATVTNWLGPAVGWPVLIVLGAGVAVYLWRSPREARGKYWGWPLLGAALGVFTSLAWLLARAGGADFTFGTSGIPTGVYMELTQGGGSGSPWVPTALLGIVLGALVAARFAGTSWVRGETARRYAELAAGGLLMGVGAGIAGGCNLGHSLVGVPLLSLGSLTTTLSMAVGVFLADRVGRLWTIWQPGRVARESAAG